MSKYSTITKGDIVELNYNDKVYELLMLELKPEGRAISIVDRDIEVDFAPPVGYVEPERPEKPKESYAIPSGSSLLSRQKIMLPKDVKLTQEKPKEAAPTQLIASESKASKKCSLFIINCWKRIVAELQHTKDERRRRPIR